MKFKRYGWLFLGVAFLVTVSTSRPVQAMERGGSGAAGEAERVARLMVVMMKLMQRVEMHQSQARPSGSGQSQETVALAARLRDLLGLLDSSPSEELAARYGYPSRENVLLKIRRVFETEGADALDADLVVEGIESIVNFARSTDDVDVRVRVFAAIEKAVTTIDQPVLLRVQEQVVVLALSQLAPEQSVSHVQAAAVGLLSMLFLRSGGRAEPVLGKERMLQLVSALCRMLLAEGRVDMPNTRRCDVDAGALAILAAQLYELGENVGQGDNVADMVKGACHAAQTRWPRADNIKDLCARVVEALESCGMPGYC